MLIIYKYISKKFIYATILVFALLLTNSCGLYKKTDSRDIPTSGIDRARKNINKGIFIIISLKKII